MTFDELKAEAKKLGYHLRRCKCCDSFDGYGAKISNGAKLGWNEAIENYNKNKEDK